MNDKTKIPIAQNKDARGGFFRKKIQIEEKKHPSTPEFSMDNITNFDNYSAYSCFLILKNHIKSKYGLDLKDSENSEDESEKSKTLRLFLYIPYKKKDRKKDKQKELIFNILHTKDKNFISCEDTYIQYIITDNYIDFSDDNDNEDGISSDDDSSKKYFYFNYSVLEYTDKILDFYINDFPRKFTSMKSTGRKIQKYMNDHDCFSNIDKNSKTVKWVDICLINFLNALMNILITPIGLIHNKKAIDKNIKMNKENFYKTYNKENMDSLLSVLNGYLNEWK